MSRLARLIATVIILIASTFIMTAQTGTIRGKVNGEGEVDPLFSASVIVTGPESDELIEGTVTDLDGAYSIDIAPGPYRVIISYLSFQSDTLNVVVEADKVIYNETLLREEGAFLDVIEITAKADTESDLSINRDKQNSVNSIDGISFNQIKRIGSNDLGDALKRVTGVSLEGGKYVTVRGLGDRYSKSLLNGGVIPALDPERNTAQLDIFPSNLVEKVLVYKNFTPDLPGDFTGGLVDIRTKSHPEDFQLSFSVSVSYNPTANLRDDFLTYQGGDLDWLGMDDGTRDFPDILNQLEDGIVLIDEKDPSNRDTLFQLPDTGGSGGTFSTINDSLVAAFADELYRSFPEYYTITEKSSGLNQNYQFSIGNQVELFERPFGYTIGLSYRRGFNYRADYELERYILTDSAFVTEDQRIAGVVTEDEVLWGGVVGLSYKLTDRSKLSLNYMRNQSGNNTTRFQRGFYDQAAPDSLDNRTMSFIERSINVFQLKGEHRLGEMTIDWNGTYSLSQDDQPDLRIYSYVYGIREDVIQFDDDGNVLLDSVGFPIFGIREVADFRRSVNQTPFRFYRELDEVNQDFRINFSQPFSIWKEQTAKLKFGGAYTFKDRDFVEKAYPITVKTGDFRATYLDEFNGDPASYFALDRFGITNVRTISTGDRRYDFVLPYEEGTNSRNSYFAEQTILAAYAMVELPLSERLKFIGGARYETTDIELVTAPAPADGSVASGSLDEQDILPSANFIYDVAKNVKLRGGYSKTIARPTFRELAPYLSFSFVGGIQFRGDTSLQRTTIDNYDLRFEWFPSGGELVSVSGFYKYLSNPIERLFEEGQNDQSTTITNVDESTALGFEIELQKNFAFISESLRPLRIGGNFSYIDSRVDVDSTTLSIARLLDPATPDQRPLYGQPNYTLNIELAYIDNLNAGLQISASYSIFGERLILVGARGFNVYEQPRGALNFSVRKKIGNNWSVRFRANNLIDPDYKQVYRFYEGAPESFLFENYKRGRSYSLGFSYSL